MKNAELLAERITPGGAIVISSTTPAEFKAVFDELKAKHPDWMALQVDQAAAIGALAAVPLLNRARTP